MIAFSKCGTSGDEAGFGLPLALAATGERTKQVLRSLLCTVC